MTVVRTGPDPDRLRRGPAHPELRRGRRFLAAYIGVMGPQDGVDIVVRAADIVVHELRPRRHRVHADRLAATASTTWWRCATSSAWPGTWSSPAGRRTRTVARILSTADVGLSPDPKNPLNDVSTMNKTMEYMAFELPVVAFDLRETRVSAGDAAVYVEPNDDRAVRARRSSS